MKKIKTILHPTDFSSNADKAMDMAASLARDYGAKLVLLHVARPPVMAVNAMMPEPPPPEEWNRAEYERQLWSRKAEGLEDIDYRLVFADSEIDAISQVAKEINADLIVMGTHGRTGLQRLLLGSVAEHVVRNAECPVLTIKTPVSKPAAEGGELGSTVL